MKLLLPGPIISGTSGRRPISNIAAAGNFNFTSGVEPARLPLFPSAQGGTHLRQRLQLQSERGTSDSTRGSSSSRLTSVRRTISAALLLILLLLV